MPSMNWDFLTDALFYGILGACLFAPLALLYAAARRISFVPACRRLGEVFDAWTSSAGATGLGKRVFGVAGLTATLVILAVGAYAANRLGDAAVPRLASAFDHFGYVATRWSVEEEHGEYDAVVYAFREVTGIRGDDDLYEARKAQMGRWSVRVFRTLVVLFALVLAAGSIDLANSAGRRREGAALQPPAQRRRGLAALLVGAVGIVASLFLWSERQDRFTRNLLASYVNEHVTRQDRIPRLPDFYAAVPREW